MTLELDGSPLPFSAGDSVALAVLRAGQHPGHGGTLCLAGDCGSCVADVDGVASVRTCQTPARDGMTVRRHPEVGGPPLFGRDGGRDRPAPAVRHRSVDVAVVGLGESGRAAVAALQDAGEAVEPHPAALLHGAVTAVAVLGEQRPHPLLEELDAGRVRGRAILVP